MPAKQEIVIGDRGSNPPYTVRIIMFKVNDKVKIKEERPEYENINFWCSGLTGKVVYIDKKHIKYTVFSVMFDEKSLEKIIEKNCDAYLHCGIGDFTRPEACRNFREEELLLANPQLELF